MRPPIHARKQATWKLGRYLRDVVKLNAAARNFRIVCPDELESNQVGAILEATDRQYHRGRHDEYARFLKSSLEVGRPDRSWIERKPNITMENFLPCGLGGKERANG